MIELRILMKPKFENDPSPLLVRVKVAVLQFRWIEPTHVENIFNTTDWKDVPVVEEVDE